MPSAEKLLIHTTWTNTFNREATDTFNTEATDTFNREATNTSWTNIC